MATRELKTGRLRLRPCRGDDLVALYDLWTEREVRRWFWDGRFVARREVEEAIRASRRSFSDSAVGIWSVSLRDTHEFVGATGLLVGSHPFFDREVFSQDDSPPELFFAIRPEHRGHGYATEAARAVLGYAFEVAGVQQVVSISDEPNVRSSRVHRRCGMTNVGTRVIHGQAVQIFVRTAQDAVPDRS